MIIPALTRYYERLEADPESDVAPFGWSRQKIGFEVVLNPDGTLHDIARCVVAVEVPQKGKGRDGEPKPPKIVERPKSEIVPGQNKAPGAGINPGFLWDTPQYMLGFKPDDPKPERTQQAFEGFRDRHLALADAIDDGAFGAVCRFLASWSPEHAAAREGLAEAATYFGVFRISGTTQYVHDCPAVRTWWDAQVLEGSDGDALPPRPSLVDGEVQEIARLHEPKIKGVRGGQSAGSLLVSFNDTAYESYRQKDGANSPVGVRDAFKYCTALNRLLADSHRSLVIGGDTYVLWAERESPIELLFSGGLLGDGDVEEAVRAKFDRLREGLPAEELGDARTPFYVLGLSPNQGRLSVRMWLESTIGEMAEHARRHFAALRLEPEPEDAKWLTVRRIVAETVPPKSGWADESQVSPQLAPQVLRAALFGLPYPRALLSGVISRMRTEGVAHPDRIDGRHVPHRRCSIIKACLSRPAAGQKQEEDQLVSLNTDHPDQAYHLGRLFAVLERIQDAAFEYKLNATIRERYYGSASATPAAVFPRLCKLKNHHIGKIDNDKPGLAHWFERHLASIFDHIESFPSTMSLESQGLFAIGYYHQREALFKKGESPEAEKPAAASA